MIVVDNVWKEYGDQIVLEKVSLTIEDRALSPWSARLAAARRRS